MPPPVPMTWTSPPIENTAVLVSPVSTTHSVDRPDALAVRPRSVKLPPTLSSSRLARAVPRSRSTAATAPEACSGTWSSLSDARNTRAPPCRAISTWPFAPVRIRSPTRIGPPTASGTVAPSRSTSTVPIRRATCPASMAWATSATNSTARAISARIESRMRSLSASDGRAAF